MTSLLDSKSIILITSSVVAGAALCYSAIIISKSITESKNKNKKNEKYNIPSNIKQSPYYDHVQLAIHLAMKCGNHMYKYCDEKGTAGELDHNLNLNYKGKPEDFCTIIDVENERYVIDGIQQQFPNHLIIGEETIGTGTIPPLTNKPTWIIDPIDGTTNFAAGLPMCCVSIGFCIDKKPIMGVIYAPMTDELYVGVVGYGAYRNNVPIVQQQNNNNNKTTLKEAVVGFEFGYARDEKEVKAMVNAVEDIMLHGCRTTRQIGSGVLDLCYVATGRLDVMYTGIATEGFKPWDFCAACVILQEAGCIIESIIPEQQEEQKQQQQSDEESKTFNFDLYSKNHICATSKELLEEVRVIIKDKVV